MKLVGEMVSALVRIDCADRAGVRLRVCVDDLDVVGGCCLSDSAECGALARLVWTDL